MASWGETGERAKALIDGVRASPSQSGALLTALAGMSLTSPTSACVAGGLGLAFLARRPTSTVGILGGETVPGMKPRRFRVDELVPIARHAETGEPILATNEYLRRHTVLYGGTEEERRSAVACMAEAMIARGSGALRIDASGKRRDFLAFARIARKHGRVDDLRHVDLTGDRLGHSFNPFAEHGSDILVQMVVSAMDCLGPTDNERRGEATALLTPLMRALVWARDEGEPLGPSRLLAYLRIQGMVRIAAGEGEWAGCPEQIRSAVADGCRRGMPGFSPERGAGQAQAVYDRYAPLEAAIARTLSFAVERPGLATILDEPSPAVSVAGAMREGRIVVVSLPADGEGAVRLARYVQAALKAGVGQEMFDEFHCTGSGNAVRHRTFPRWPFAVLSDVVGPHLVSGLAQFAAQARGFGAAMVYVTPTIAALEQDSGLEAQALLCNTITRIQLPPEDPEDAYATLHPLYKDEPGVRATLVGPKFSAPILLPFPSDLGPTAEPPVMVGHRSGKGGIDGSR